MKNIPGYEGIYGCDEHGKIYSLSRIIRRNYASGKASEALFPLKEKRSSKRKDGYLQVALRKSGKNKNWLVHRLVGITFLGLKENQKINHLDGNKANNNLENLEVCTLSQNVKYDFKMGRRSNSGENHPLFFIDEVLKNKVRALLNEGLSQQKVADIVGMSQVAVSKIKLNKGFKKTLLP